MGRGLTNSDTSEHQVRTPLRCLGSRIKLIRAGNTLSLSKTLPITLTLLLLLGGVSGAEFRADSSDIEWKQPFNPENTNMPVHYSSGTTPALEVEVKQDFTSSPGEIIWYRKKASDTSWTQIESEQLEPKWDHDSTSGAQDYNAQTFFPEQEGSTLTLNEDESQTVTINGQEVTIANNGIGISDNPQTVLMEVDGVQFVLYEGEYFTENGAVLRIDEIAEDDIGNERIEIDSYSDQLNPGDGNWEYKVEAETSSGTFYHSYPLYFDINSLTNNNAPYISKVELNTDSAYTVAEEFNTLTGVNPGSTVTATVIQQEDDPYNLTLVDRDSKTEIQEYQVTNASFDTLYSDIIGAPVEIFGLDASFIQGQDKVEVPFKLNPEENQGSSFLNVQGSTYNLGFLVEDRQSNVDRATTDYTVETSGTNEPPTVNSIEGSGDCSTYSNITGFDTGSFECIRVNATDPNNEQLFVSLNLTQEYDNVVHNQFNQVTRSYQDRNGDYYIFNLSKIDEPINNINDSGEWTAAVEASDGINNDTLERTWTVPWGELQFTDYSINGNQGDTEVLKNNLFWANTTIQCINGECASTNETVIIELDPLKNTKKTFQGPIHKGEKLSTGIALTLYDKLSALAQGDGLK